MKFLDNTTIRVDKVLNELDRFVLKFIDILKKHSKYVIVSGYVSILFGRSRASEDIDVIVPPLGAAHFNELFSDLSENNFYCLNTSKVREAFKHLSYNAIRFAIKGTSIPNIEFKFAKRPVDNESLNDTLTVKTPGGDLVISCLEIQIPFKKYVLGSDKDVEDAIHLEKVFEQHLNISKLNNYAERFRNEGI
jgi:hypothetical protein